jgi:hypothetical protein
MIDQTNTQSRTPAWWNDTHTSTWDRVKGALERDWEQTKADFSENSGQRLNQSVSDTIKQSVGSKPIPPLFVKTRPTDPKVTAKEEEKARGNMEKASEKTAKTVSKAQDDILEENRKLNQKVDDIRKEVVNQQTKATDKTFKSRATASDKIADARTKADQGIAKGYEKIEEAGAKRDEAVAKWHDAEREVRYGYSVRSQYPSNSMWNDSLEEKLRVEWESLDTGASWSASKAGIRRGWEYAGEPR